MLKVGKVTTIENNNMYIPDILAVDLGTTTGIAIYAKNKIRSYSKSFKPSRFESSDIRFVNFNKHLHEIQELDKIEKVYYEEVRKHIGVDAAHCYGGFKSVLTAFCITNNIPYEGVSVGTIKKFITGKGNASKKLVIKAVREMGHDPSDDNEADALAIAYYAKDQAIRTLPQILR